MRRALRPIALSAVFLLAVTLNSGGCASRTAPPPVAPDPPVGVSKVAPPTTAPRPLTPAEVVDSLYQPTRRELIFSSMRLPFLKRIFTSRPPGAVGVQLRLNEIRRRGGYAPQPEDAPALRIIMRDGETSLPARCAAAYFLLALDDPAAAAFVRDRLNDPDLTSFHNAVEILAWRLQFDRPAAWEVERLTALSDDPRLRDPAEPAEWRGMAMWDRDMAATVRYALDTYRARPPATRPAPSEGK